MISRRALREFNKGAMAQPRDVEESFEDTSAYVWPRLFHLTAALGVVIGLLGAVELVLLVAVRPGGGVTWMLGSSALAFAFAGAVARLLVLARRTRRWRHLVCAFALCFACTGTLIGLSRLLGAA
ncbi:hypothetical protein [Streptomyces sp. NPDC050145]|uniref:hypothetical protein n=1 Tax=Streptomyces sp. NPDC050145 TaxID=3365602 RepID=UPI00378B1DE6